MNELIVETYPPMFSDYDNNVENENYDNEIRVFAVPKEWALKWISDFGMTYEEWCDECTWDDTFQMYSDAVDEEVLIRETIEPRV